ncbi:MAG: hypothetical protein GY938_12720 [Ketobacter sp.]|nr:hypothetical protein [Ketobacter sp.]
MASQTLDVIEDAHERRSSTFFNDTNSVVRMDDNSSDSSGFNGGFYFELTSAIPSGATVDDAYLTLEMDSTDNPEVDIYANDTADADDFTTDATLTARTRTAASASWSDTGLTGSQQSPSFTSVIQELVDDNGGLASGAGVMIILVSKGSGSSTFRVDAIDGSGTPADLYIEWTESGGGGRIMGGIPGIGGLAGIGGIAGKGGGLAG